MTDPIDHDPLHDDPDARRKRQRAAKLKADEEKLAATGIRTLRDKPVFTTPNVFAPEDHRQDDVDDPDFRETLEPQHCYVCKSKYTELHHFYDQLCPDCAEVNFRKRTELADPIDEFPRTQSGKVQKFVLRDRLREGRIR